MMIILFCWLGHIRIFNVHNWNNTIKELNNRKFHCRFWDLENDENYKLSAVGGSEEYRRIEQIICLAFCTAKRKYFSIY